MTRGVPASWLVLFGFVTSIGSVPIARADDERRQVAVIDLSEDDQVRELSNAIYMAINASEVLKIPNVRGFDPYLTGRLYDEDEEDITRAKDSLADAENRLGQFDSVNAMARATEGQNYLAEVVPTAAVQAVFADLSLVLGLSLLDQRNATEANLAFAFAHRLDPARQLDPGRYPPNIISAYQHAADAKPATFPVEIKGTGRVWIDFVERGPAPGTFEGLDAGLHVIVVTGPDRLTYGKVVKIAKAASMEIPDRPASDELKVKRARLELSRAQTRHDDVARASAMKKLAALLAIGDAVMISKRPDGRLQWETWRDRAPGFSATKPARKDGVTELLDSIVPPKQHVEPPTGPFKGPIVIEKPWYEERWVQASAAATVVGAIIGVIVYARRDRPFITDPNIQQGM